MIKKKYITVAATILIFILAYAIGSIMYKGFFTMRTFLSLFNDNAYLGISAVGMTLVILSGGIDLSVGAIAALSTMIIAYGTEELGLDPFLCMAICVVYGILIGTAMGAMIEKFKVPPFIATLAGMFFSRGLCFVISIQSITINNPVFRELSSWKLKLPGNSYITLSVVIFLVVVALGIYITQYTKFGRSIYAVGGNELSAKLMGLPVSRTKITIYGINGVCSALAGIAFAMYMCSGYPRHLIGMELDAIASVVIGGTLLTGGSGYVIGTVFGVLTLGLIQTFINFNGTLSTWWTKIFVGVLLLLFIGLQRLVVYSTSKSK